MPVKQIDDGSAAAGRRAKWITAGVCAGLLVLFAVLSFTAILGKSATFDEPLHAVGGFIKMNFGDYRVNPEDPALFGLWSALFHGKTALVCDVGSTSYRAIQADIRSQWNFVIDVLYRTRENDADEFLALSRAMFMFLSVGLGALIAWWSWKLAAGDRPAAMVGAIVATTLFALDPNFMAHGSLVKNDVALALLMLALGYSLWQFGRYGSWWRLLVVALVCGIALNVKFSAVLFGPMTVLILIGRAVLPVPWRVCWIDLPSVWTRLAAVAGVSVICLITAWVVTWAVYGFRYAPMSDGSVFDTTQMVIESRIRELRASKPDPLYDKITREEFDAKEPSGKVRAILWMMDKRVLPQGWLYGFLYTYATTLIRGAYLLGGISVVGWWYYFPLAMLFKTPVATLLAVFAAGALGMGRLVMPAMRRGRWAAGAEASLSGYRLAGLDVWMMICLIVPPGIYFLAALTTNLNLGLRHILPVYPYLFIGCGLAAAKLVRVWPRPVKFAGAALALLLAVETISAYPNYIPFFNVVARNAPGADGGLNLLADSNLDWGQDLKQLAEWRKQHKDHDLFLAYFGTADPGYYGIDYENMGERSGGYSWSPPTQKVPTGYVAVSGTSLQGVYIDPSTYRVLRDRKPVAVLGDSIYVYEWNIPGAEPPPTPPPSDSAPVGGGSAPGG